MMTKEELKERLLSDLEKLRTQYGYLNAGYPNFSTLFGRDSLISAWQMLEMDPEIARATLAALAKHQGKVIDQKSEEEPGKILHELIGSSPHWKFPYFGSVDSTPLFVIVADEYLNITGDSDFILKIWENIVAAISWIPLYGDADQDNFIEYERKNTHGLFHQGWRDSGENHLKIKSPVAIVEAQGYAYAAYRAAASLAEKLGKNKSDAVLWLKKAEALRESFQKSFWWEEESYYYLALNADKLPRESVSSNPGHLLFTGIIPEEVLYRFVRRLFQPDLFTPYGIRTLSENDPDFNPLSYHLGSIWPHDNWIIHRGLVQLGFLDEARMIKQALLSAYQKLGQMPELFGVEGGMAILLSPGSSSPGESLFYANPLQAWSICGLLNMVWKD